MGMYTEIVVGIALKGDAPESVVKAVRYMASTDQDGRTKPDDFPLKGDRSEWMFHGSSYYFPNNIPHCSMIQDTIDKTWQLDVRANIKNYSGEIEEFFEWIAPYVESQGEWTIMGYSRYEEDDQPWAYYAGEDGACHQVRVPAPAGKGK